MLLLLYPLGRSLAASCVIHIRTKRMILLMVPGVEKEHMCTDRACLCTLELCMFVNVRTYPISGKLITLSNSQSLREYIYIYI